MSGRIAQRFAALKAEGRGGLITFITAGDPDFASSLEIFKRLPESGADIIELGIPFSDPMADGPAIQASSRRALNAGASVAKTLAMVDAFRRGDDQTPVVLMGYYNPVYAYGKERFVRDAAKAGVDGLIIVDLPPEEAGELLTPAKDAGINLIYLTTPTTDDKRLPKVLEHAGGFVYYVSIAGVTGAKSAALSDISEAVGRLRRHTELPVAVGFGIRTPSQAAAVAKIADAAVVGSALVDKVTENLNADGSPGPGMVRAVLGLVHDLSEGIRK